MAKGNREVISTGRRNASLLPVLILCTALGFIAGNILYQFCIRYAPALLVLDGAAPEQTALGFFVSLFASQPLGLELGTYGIGSGALGALIVLAAAYPAWDKASSSIDPGKAYGTARFATARDRAPYAHTKDRVWARRSLLDLAHRLGYTGDTRDFTKERGTILSRFLDLFALRVPVRWPCPPTCESIEDDNIILSKHSRVALSDNPNRRYSPANRHIYMIAGSGSGKTYRFVKTNVMQLNASFAFTDPKGELYADTSRFLADHGYGIRVIDLRDEEAIKNGDRVNPFRRCENMTDIDNTILMFINVTTDKRATGDNPYFTEQMKNAFSAVGGALFFLGRISYEKTGSDASLNICNFPAILDWLVLLEQKNGMLSPCDLFFDGTMAEHGVMGYRERILRRHHGDKEAARRSPEWAPLISWDTFKAIGGAAETRSSIISTCLGRLNLFGRAAVRELFSSDTLDLDLIGRQKMAYYFITKDTGGPYDFAAAIAMSQLFDINARIADALPERHLPIPVICYLDELANIGEIANLSKLFATLRSRWINLVAITQDLSQLKTVYGDFAKSIYSNSSTTLYFGGSDNETCEAISTEIGETTIAIPQVSVSRSASGAPSTTTSVSYVGRRLIKADEMRSETFKGSGDNSPGRCLTHLTETDWYLDEKPDPRAHRRWPELAAAPKANIADYPPIRDHRIEERLQASLDRDDRKRIRTVAMGREEDVVAVTEPLAAR